MSIKRLAVLSATIMAFLLATKEAAAITLDYSNVPGATIRFIGGSKFQFPNGAGGFDFAITGPTSIGLQGNITGTFDIVGPPGGTTRPVTGSGSFSIFDGVDTLTADLDWVDILATGAVGGLNFTGTVNLSNIAYTGGNADLQSMVAGGNTVGIVTLSFQDARIQSLDNLRNPAGGVLETSYSGSATVPPPSVPDGGATIFLMATGLFGIALGSRRLGLAR